MFKHILIGIDFSSQSQQLYLFGNQLANHFGSNLELVHVFHPQQQRGSLRTGKNTEQLQEYFQRKLIELGQKTSTSAISPGFSKAQATHRVVLRGFPEEELIKHRKKAGVDLMILGIPGMSFRRPSEFGRIAMEIAEEIECPIMLLPSGIQFENFQKILFINDETHLSDSIVEHMAGIAYFFGAEIHFIHINNKTDHASTTFQKEFEEAIRVQAPDMSVFYRTVSSNNLLEKINCYILDRQIDFLNIATANRHFWNEFSKEKMGNTYQLSKNLPILISPVEE